MFLARLASTLLTLVPTTAFAQSAPPPFVQRGMPGVGQAALQPLIGTWRVEKETFIAGGTAARPLRGTLSCTREVIAGGRFLRDVTQGAMNSQPYYRTGLLGYSNEDRRYEWVTADGLNANMMIYLGAPGSGPARAGAAISMTGTFTDQGVVGPNNAGRSTRQRTVIRIEGPDRHVVELYFTPQGGREFLADRGTYTRVAP